MSECVSVCVCVCHTHTHTHSVTHIEDGLKVETRGEIKVHALRSFPFVCMCLHLRLITIATCIFFGLLEVFLFD